MKIALLCDNPESWIIPHALELRKALEERGHLVSLVHSADDISEGDIACFLSCEHIVPKGVRNRNAHNLIVHESALPEGKGWSPLTWQILEGINDIPMTLFEAADEVDSGAIYATETTRFEGHELIDEMRDVQGKKTVELILRFIDMYPSVEGKSQAGNESFYPRREPKDSELDPHKSIVELFDQLRVADNERYPAFFKHKGKTYVLKIYKKE